MSTSTWWFTSNMIAYNLMVLFVMLALDAKAELSGEFNFTKFVFYWPTSYCTSFPPTIHERERCQEPFKTHFLVRGSWPMYWDDDDVTIKELGEWPVPAYNLSNCSEIEPPSEDIIQATFFNTTLPLFTVMEFWPNIFDHSNVDSNIRYLRRHWIRHGKCSENRDDPFLYFKNPIDYIKKYNFLQILATGEINPDDGEYDPRDIIDVIEQGVGVKPQIGCITDSQNTTVLLNEILLCFDRGGISMPCRYDFSDCPEFDPEFKIKFPVARTHY